MNPALRELARRAVAAAATAAAVSALTIAGAGNAQALEYDSGVLAIAVPGGVRIQVEQNSGKAGWCTYTATPQAGSPLLPYASLPFFLGSLQKVEFFIPGIQTGTGWTPQVNCDHGGNQTAWMGYPGPLYY